MANKGNVYQYTIEDYFKMINDSYQEQLKIKEQQYSSGNENNSKIIEMPQQNIDDEVETNSSTPVSEISVQDAKNDETKTTEEVKQSIEKVKGKTEKKNKEIAIKVEVEKPKPEMPDILKSSLEKEKLLDFIELFGYNGYNGICLSNDYRYRSNNQRYFNVIERGNCEMLSSCSDSTFGSALRGYYDSDSCGFNANLLYVADGVAWTAKLSVKTKGRLQKWMSVGQFITEEITSFKVSRWRVCEKVLNNCSLLQTKQQLTKMLQNENPYGYKYVQEKNVDVSLYWMFPAIEILHKAGYDFASNLADKEIDLVDSSEIENFNRLCQPGTNPKQIFKTTKSVYETLKHETNLRIWDVYRKMNKFGRVTPDVLKRLYDRGYGEKELGQINSILGHTYQGKRIFTWDSLNNYLDRLDTFEAIDGVEALMLLSDYLIMCRTLEMKPKVDGDSLKREHDIAARMCRYRKDEIKAQKMEQPCNDMQKYNYSESIYLIRGIQNYNDLLDEAKQQHNCVAGYADRIINKTSLIYVMRLVDEPDRSLITVELSPNGQEIRQKYKAYNKPINNKSQTEFLERWLKYVKVLAKEEKLSECKTEETATAN